MSDCYRACDDNPYDDPSSPAAAAAAAPAAACLLPLLPNKWSNPLPNKWSNPPPHARSEILVYLSEIAEHDTLRGAVSPHQTSTDFS
jgi:hypothetical protein